MLVVEQEAEGGEQSVLQAVMQADTRMQTLFKEEVRQRSSLF
eukprot:SAG22_NODE_2858_length_2152_cov_1.417925_1_plen_42_part_00